MATIPAAPPVAPVPEPRRGVYTSEFWVSILTAVAGIVGQIAGILPPPWGIILTAIGTAAFTISRGLAKSGTTTGP